MVESSKCWFDEKDNISVVRYNTFGKTVPIEGDAILNGLKIGGSLYVTSPVKGGLYAKNIDIGEDVDAEGAKIGGGLEIKGKVGGTLRINDAEIGGVYADVVAKSIYANNIRTGKFSLYGKTESLNLEKASMKRMDISGAEIERFYVDGMKTDFFTLHNVKIRRIWQMKDANVGELTIHACGYPCMEFDLRNTKIERMSAESGTDVGLLDLRGTEIKDFALYGYDTPFKFDFYRYRIDKDTKLPKNLKDLLSKHDEEYKKELRASEL